MWVDKLRGWIKVTVCACACVCTREAGDLAMKARGRQGRLSTYEQQYIFIIITLMNRKGTD